MFAGRHVAAAALERGWQVTLFHRGRTGADLFPDAEHVLGDRDGGLGALATGEWDAVVDTSGYVPRLVRASAEGLIERAEQYLFVSSAGVYADKSQPAIREDAPLVALDDPTTEDVEQHYDGLKVLCERAVADVFPAAATIVRPGLIVGPHDPTNRFTYWVTRIAAGGAVLAPEPRDQAVQVIDARDLAGFILALIADRRAGTYNAVGDRTTMEATLTTIVETTASDAQLHWRPERELVDAGVEPWQDLPLWLAPNVDPSYAGFLAMSNERAKAAGLTLRPLAETVEATLEWARTAPPATGSLTGGPAGLDAATEQRLLSGGSG